MRWVGDCASYYVQEQDLTTVFCFLQWINSPAVVRSRQIAEDSSVVAKKLLWSTGKAAWIAGTTFLILAVPLIIEMDRETQLIEMETAQGLLGAPPAPVRV